jgi:CubicO group peptidase (beta-lactamase class C family)
MSGLAELGDTLERVVTRAMGEQGVPGAALVLASGDEERLRCFGVLDAESGVPVSADALFQVGSVTKTLTATLLRQLVQEGRLDIDAPVRDLVPELRLADRSVLDALTCRHLLAHVAGFEGDAFLDTGDGSDALARYAGRLDETPQVAPFDWTHSYCNAGYAILGRVVEARRDMPFEDAARRFVLAPLGMSRATFTWRAPAAPVASGHVVSEGVARVVRPWRLFRAINPAGGLAATAHDLAAYARFHLRGGAGLTREALESMWHPLYAADKSPTGFAWTTTRAGAMRVVAHGGSTVSQTAQLSVLPEAAFAYAVLTNADRGSAIIRAVTRAILEHFGAPAASTAFRTVSAERRAEYAGRYRAAIYQVEVGGDDEGVWLEAVRRGGMDAHQSPRPAPLPRMRLDFTGDDRAVIRNGPFAEAPVWFARDRAGTVAWVKFYGRLTPRAASKRA